MDKNLLKGQRDILDTKNKDSTANVSEMILVQNEKARGKNLKVHNIYRLIKSNHHST